MGRHILYIINPISGTRTKKDLTALLTRATTEQQIPFSVYTSVAGGDYSFLRPVIAEQAVTDVVIAGGDGTVNQVVGSLRDCDVNFGIIPCGSGNGLAFAARIPRQPARAQAVIFQGKAVPIDGFTINNQFACMLCGLGFDATVAHEFARQTKRGLATYVKQVIKQFFAALPYTFELSLSGNVITTSAYFISIANSNQFGNNFTIAPQASLNDGLLDIVIVTNQPKPRLLLQTLQQVRGKNKLKTDAVTGHEKGVIYFQTEGLSIRNLSAAPLHIDGEPAATPAALEIRVLKKAFRLIQPA